MKKIKQFFKFIAKYTIGLQNAKKIYRKLKGLFIKKYHCNICGYYGVFNPFGVKRTPNRRCPQCGSLERHRFLKFLYEKYIFNNRKKLKGLYFAPEKSLVNLFKDYKNIQLDFADLDPDTYNFVKTQNLDITNINIKNNTYDFVIANHVLEHVDDKKAIEEVMRVLKPGEKFFISIPVYDIPETFEDLSIKTAKDREKYYGQRDHIRKYGRDVIERFKSFGFKVELIKMNKLLSRKIKKKYQLYRKDILDYFIIITNQK